MPAEWEPHEATWIAWPHNRDDWPGKFPAIPWVYAEIVRILAAGEEVRILVNDARAAQHAASILERNGVRMEAVTFFEIPTDRVWTRDSGPAFIVRRAANRAAQSAIINWKFNAWAKYPDWTRDDRIPGTLAKILRLPQWKPAAGRQRIVLEGGSIDVNGQGLLLTTEECLLDTVQQRNPGIGRAAIETALRDYLGATRVIWLGRGIAGDDTHGHVDDIARFTGASTVVAAWEPDRSDPNHEPLADNLRRLRAFRDARGNALRIVKLPMPAPVVFHGQRLPASYANFYIANAHVLVPVFNDPNDRAALGILQKLFPSRRVVGIGCRDLVWGLGTLHCMTQQQPLA